MKVKITDPAKGELKRIYAYYRRRGYSKKGRRIRKAVMQKAMFLKE